MNEQEWKVREPTGECAACGQSLPDGAAMWSRLFFAEGEGYQRRDSCSACAGKAADDGAISVWKTVYRREPPKEEPLKKETAESLLRQLIETNDPAREGAIFVLAVMLERRRIFVERDVQLLEDGGKRRIYEHRGTGETFVIADPQLKLRDLEHVQQEVVILLGGRPPGEPAPAPEAGVPAATPAPGN
jgi:hypothetical protein